jgi:hypothetical protein
MTIAITLQTQGRTYYNNNNNHRSMSGSTSSSSSSMKVHPFRKLQRYRSDSNMIDEYNCRRPKQQQILPNGFTVVPMLSLHDAAAMNYKQKQQQQQQQPCYPSNLYQTHSESSFSRAPYPSSCASFERKYYDMRQQTMNTMFPTLTPSLTTVFSLARDGYVATPEESSMSSSNSMTSVASRYCLEQQESLVPIKEKKHVRFAPTATVHTRSVSDDDLYNSWYDANDYLNFETENRHIVSFIYDKMKQFSATNELSKVSLKVMTKYLIEVLNNDQYGIIQYQILGLEQFIFGPKHMLQRRKETMEHSLMVLEMYDVQRTMQQYNPDVLRRVSERYSNTKVERAIRRAQFCCNHSAIAA